MDFSLNCTVWTNKIMVIYNGVSNYNCFNLLAYRITKQKSMFCSAIGYSYRLAVHLAVQGNVLKYPCTYTVPVSAARR